MTVVSVVRSLGRKRITRFRGYALLGERFIRRSTSNTVVDSASARDCHQSSTTTDTNSLQPPHRFLFGSDAGPQVLERVRQNPYDLCATLEATKS